MNFATIKDAILFLLAIYGAGLSTFNLVQASKKERRTVRVTLSTAIPAHGPQFGPSFVRIEAVNVGYRLVTITSLTLQLQDGSRLAFLANSGFPVPDTVLPISLSDGHTAQRHISYRDLGIALLESGRRQPLLVTPVCEDTAGGRHTGEPWTVDPIEFSRM